MTQFYQHKIGNKITDRSVYYAKSPVPMPLHRTTVNTPPTGYYYVNEHEGLYIFSVVDWERGISISYTDIEKRGPSAHLSIFFGKDYV